MEDRRFITSGSSSYFTFMFSLRGMEPSTSIAIVVLVAVFVMAINRQRNDRRNPKRLPHPPGPKPLPVLGNFLDIPRNFVSGPYQKMAKEHGKPPTTELKADASPDT